MLSWFPDFQADAENPFDKQNSAFRWSSYHHLMKPSARKKPYMHVEI